jgi:hypothetical protein
MRLLSSIEEELEIVFLLPNAKRAMEPSLPIQRVPWQLYGNEDGGVCHSHTHIMSQSISISVISSTILCHNTRIEASTELHMFLGIFFFKTVGFINTLRNTFTKWIQWHIEKI